MSSSITFKSHLVNRIYYLYYVRRHASIKRLFFYFFLVTFFLTAYLYGLVQIDSHKLVINIFPEENIAKPHKTLPSKKSYEEEPWPPYDLDEKVVKFFDFVEKYAPRIRQVLKKSEQEYVKRLRKTYENVTESLDRIEAEAEDKNKNREQKLTYEKNIQDKGPDDHNEDYDKEKKTKTASTVIDQQVSRDDLIKILKYEKIKYKLKKIRTVENVIHELHLKDELDKEDLDINKLPDVWRDYYFKINELKLYDNPTIIDSMLQSVATSSVIAATEKEKGTQIKLMLALSNGIEVLIKPMKVPRNYETPPDHFYFVDFERHHAEIAAFHLDKLLGFYRVPPTVGRVFNITSELWDNADEELAKTFFYSPGGNTCFTGHCSYYCDSTHATCGRPKDRLEASVQVYLPSKPIIQWKAVIHPYRRTYTKKKKAEWEKNEKYCVYKLFQDLTYHSKLFLDLIDLSIFDFLTSNMDRHHYERMVTLNDNSFIVHVDNGRSFGKIFSDEMSILAPLRQCCIIRYSTYERLKSLYKNRFSKLLDNSLRSDPLYPILTMNHFKAIDRRMDIIFHTLMNCTQFLTPTEVIIDDGY